MSLSSLKYLYDLGLYTNEQFKVFVVCKWINEGEYYSVTGVEYSS